MSRRHFDRTENAELRAKIDAAKRRLSLPELMRQLGHGEHVNLRGDARCPFHRPDKRPSFAIMEKDDGTWHWTCFASCGNGDEINYLAKAKGLTNDEATKRFLEMAGFPLSRPPKCPGCRESPKSPCVSVSPVFPVSNGHGLDKELEKELKELAARCACTHADDQAGKRRFEFARGARAVEKRIGRELTTGERLLALTEWHRVSQPFLDPNDDHLATFLAELGKVRVPTGEGETITKALGEVSTLSVCKLPVIPGIPDARESWRRIAALHRELSRRSTKTNKTYFLGCRDAASVFPGLSHQTAYNINLALAQLGVIKIVRIGDARPNGKASKFRYLLPQTENGASQTDEEVVESLHAYASKVK